MKQVTNPNRVYCDECAEEFASHRSVADATPGLCTTCGGYEATRTGRRTFGDDDSCSYRWATFDRKACNVENEQDAMDLAMATFGPAFYAGPGRGFRQSPMVKLGRMRVLVIQQTGLDI